MHYSVYYQNVRGMRTKLNILSESIASISYDVLVLTETWLTPNFYNNELYMDNFTVYRKDRLADTSPFSRGGGVLVAVSNNIQSIGLPSSPNIEDVFVLLGSGKNIVIMGAVYFPPRSPSDVYQSFSSDLDLLVEKYPSAFICLLGDFNLPRCRWEITPFSSNAYPPQGTPLGVTDALEVLSTMSSFHNLYQNNQVTNVHGSILDLVFTENQSTAVHLADEVLLPLDAYHPALNLQIELDNATNNNCLECDDFYRDFKNADWNLFSDFLSQFNWDVMLSGRSLDEMINIFYEVLYLAIDTFIPLKKFSSKKFPRWYSAELKTAIIQKKLAHKQYKQSCLHSDFMEFSRLRSLCKVLTRWCYRDYIDNTERSLNANLKQFWNFVNSRRKDNGLPKVMCYNDSQCSNGVDIVNLFADYFATTYCDKNCDLPDNSLSFNNINVTSCNISISTVYEKLSRLDVSKGPGPDEVPPIVLRNNSFILARPLFIIFNQSLLSGCFPNYWKVSFISPIYKSGDRNDVANYRPISLISTIPKLFESIICDFLRAQLTCEIVQQQFGFMSKKSTELNLLLYSDFLASALEDGVQVHSLYTDFSKAFDRVNHRILLCKLKRMGISGALLDWLGCYLTDRTQVVRVNGFKSRDIRVSSGVPQGSHLGPLLFNVFINDVKDCFQFSEFLLFADDLKFFRRVTCLDDCLKLQSDLSRLSEWCRVNCMDLNVDKCHVMFFTRSNNVYLHDYYLGNDLLTVASEIRDLGVTFDPALGFGPHITRVISKSLQMLGFIKRCAHDFHDIDAIRLLYCVLVRPHLEYASCLWSPCYNIYIHKIEQVQRRFLRFAAFKMNIDPNYQNLESLLKLDRLETRRKHRDLKMLYKIVNGLVECPELLSRLFFHVPPRVTRSVSQFHEISHRTNYGRNSFISRASRLANGFSDQLDFLSCSYSQFVRSLKCSVA